MPVLILPRATAGATRWPAFDAGADDYLAKPFHMEEVLARVRALLRRAAGHATSEIGCGPLGSTPRRRASPVNGQPVKLTSLEFRLLAYLMHHKGRVVSRTELVEHSTTRTSTATPTPSRCSSGGCARSWVSMCAHDQEGSALCCAPSRMMRPSSLAFRLTVSAAIVSLVLLGVGGTAPLLSVPGHDRAQFRCAAAGRAATGQELANVEVNEDGAPVILGAIADTRFRLPLSGWYWQVSAKDGRPD